jgi:hypothetical protein
MYEVWQTGVSAKLSTHPSREKAATAWSKALSKFRRSKDYNPGTLIGFEIRRTDGEPMGEGETWKLRELQQSLMDAR